MFNENGRPYKILCTFSFNMAVCKNKRFHEPSIISPTYIIFLRFKFQFEIEGHTGAGYHSDIAIDDIIIHPGNC